MSVANGALTRPCDVVGGPWTMKFNTCFQIPLLVKAIISDEFVANMAGFLPALCAETTPECPLDLRQQATAELTAACINDNAQNPGGIPALTLVAVSNYDKVKAALCSKNLKCVGGTHVTNHSGTYCAIETMATVQKRIGTKINYLMFRDAINGNSTYLPQLSSLLQDGVLCTGCVSRYLHLGAEIDTTVPLPDALPSVRARCGAHFGGGWGVVC